MQEDIGALYWSHTRHTLVEGETFHGYIKDKSDAVLVIEACRRAYLPLVRERLNDFQRESIRCGSVYVFHEDSSGIKRWTDGLVWTPSRNLLGFIHYREVQKTCSQKYSRSNPSLATLDSPSNSPSLHSDTGHLQHSLITACKQYAGRQDTACKRSTSLESLFKPNGFYKKCISYELQDGVYHLISYTRIPESMYPERLIPSNISTFQSMKLTSSIVFAVAQKENSINATGTAAASDSGQKYYIKERGANLMLSGLQQLAAAAKESQENEGGVNYEVCNLERNGKLKIFNLLNKQSN